MPVISAEIVTRLWAEHGPALVLYARQWCNSPEDIVQEAFLLLTQQNITPDNPVGWIYRVVRNRAINVAKSCARRSRRETAAATVNEPWFEATGDNNLDAIEATEALKLLPIEQREVIVARLWGGLSFDEIACATESSLSTIYRCYQRGLATLRERLGWSCQSKKAKTKT